MQKLDPTREAQAKAALRHGNEIRLARAGFRKRVRWGLEDPAKIIRRPPECCDTLALIEFLMWLPRVGRSRARAMIRDLIVGERVPLSRLSRPTRELLAKRIERELRRQQLGVRMRALRAGGSS